MVAIEKQEKEARAEVAAEGSSTRRGARLEDEHLQANKAYEVFNKLARMFSMVGLNEEEAIQAKVRFRGKQDRRTAESAI